MNANAQPHVGSRAVENLLRQHLASPKHREALLRETGWDASMISKVTSGTTGITLANLDSVLRALGLSIVTVEYMDYLARGNVIGSNCYCARASMGQCGPRG
jgi:hypothetical protein